MRVHPHKKHNTG
jgi:hypothetical protein